MIRLTTNQIIQLHEDVINATGGDRGLRDINLLDSACQAPFQTFGGVPLYPSLEDKASKLCYGLVMNHAFLDGNKRIGVHSALVFLTLNGVKLKYTQLELINLIISIADNKITNLELVEWIKAHKEGRF